MTTNLAPDASGYGFVRKETAGRRIARHIADIADAVRILFYPVAALIVIGCAAGSTIHFG